MLRPDYPVELRALGAEFTTELIGYAEGERVRAIRNADF
jgi:hypothetical protein